MTAGPLSGARGRTGGTPRRAPAPESGNAEVAESNAVALAVCVKRVREALAELDKMLARIAYEAEA